MKKNLILILACLFTITALHAQHNRFKSPPNPGKKIGIKEDAVVRESPSGGQYTPQSFLSQTMLSSSGTIDTLNYPLEGEYHNYFLGCCGYPCGTNGLDHHAKASVFDLGAPSILEGVLIDFSVANYSDTYIKIAAWDDSGPDGSPGEMITVTTLTMADISNDVQDGVTTYIPFETPALMTPTFYVGVVLPGAGDSLAVYSNTDGDTQPTTAWEQWQNDEWHRFDEVDSWGLKIALAIFPIVNTETGLWADFYADNTVVQPGNSVSFFDTSVGGVVSREWWFEGGDPETSTEKDPVVTYQAEGLYDVTLIVGNGEEFDTLAIPDYIQVALYPPQVDTLDYPLTGEPAVYKLYSSSDGSDLGYVCGTNFYHDQSMANYFNNSADLMITGLLVDFVEASGGNPGVELAIWDNDGLGGRPGTKLTGEEVALNTIKSDITLWQMTYVAFSNPVNIDHPFYAGFGIPTTPGDTIAAWHNSHGDSDPGIAWVQWLSGQWVAFSDANSSFGLNFEMAIFPVVEYQTGIGEVTTSYDIPVFPKPASGWVRMDLSQFPGSGMIELFQADGNRSGRWKFPAGKGVETLDLTGFPSGIHLLRITGDSYYVTKKIILE